jgi:hypothetical protein
MTIVQTQKSIVVHCPDCGHFKSRHEKRRGCLICAALIERGMMPANRQCRNHFISRLSPRELEQARAVAKDTYKGKTVCATCYEIWWAHDGMICPNGSTLFVPLIGGNA